MGDYCANCGKALEPGAKFCGSCGAVALAGPVSQSVAPAPRLALSEAPRLTSGKRYPVLRVITVILKVFAVLSAVAGLISGISLLTTPSSRSSFGESVGYGSIGFFTLLGGVCTGLFLWAAAEMIHVLMAIEENTRRGPESGR